MYYTQQVFQGQRERILRFVAEETDTTAAFIHIFDEQRPYTRDSVRELEGDAVAEAFTAADVRANTLSVNFMPLVSGDAADIDGHVLTEGQRLIVREYALLTGVQLTFFEQAIKADIEVLPATSPEEHLLELITRILGSSQIGLPDRSLSLYLSSMVQEQATVPEPEVKPQIILPE